MPMLSVDFEIFEEFLKKNDLTREIFQYDVKSHHITKEPPEVASKKEVKVVFHFRVFLLSFVNK